MSKACHCLQKGLSLKVSGQTGMSLTLDSLAGSEREEKLTWMKGADISGLSCLRETVGPMRIAFLAGKHKDSRCNPGPPRSEEGNSV